MSCGALLEVVATDPGVVNDIPAWCRLNGHNVRSIDQEGREIIVLVEIGSGG
jgi:tRNA 2-thiouridine synthesizing protein A